MPIYHLLFFAYLTILLASIVLIFRRFNSQPRAIRWLGIALLTSWSADVIMLAVFLLGYLQNIVGNIYSFLGIPLFSLFFYYAIGWPEKKKFFIIVNVIYLAFSTINLLLLQKIDTHNTYTLTLQAIIMLSYCIIFYFKLMKELPTMQLQTMPLFWIVSGFFLAWSGKVVIHAITAYMINYRNDPHIVTLSMHHVLTIIQNIFLLIGVWLQVRPKTA